VGKGLSGGKWTFPYFCWHESPAFPGKSGAAFRFHRRPWDQVRHPFQGGFGAAAARQLDNRCRNAIGRTIPLFTATALSFPSPAWVPSFISANVPSTALERPCSKPTRWKTKVTTIAANLGFTKMGRFSVRYRELFGESSSQTLARRPRCIVAIPG
jgi:hypothetical protein